MIIEMNCLNVPAVCYQKEPRQFSGNQAFLSEFSQPEDRLLLQEFIDSSPDLTLDNEFTSKKFLNNGTEYILLSIPNIPECQIFFFFLNTSTIQSTLSQLSYIKQIENNFYKFLGSIYDDFTIINKEGIIEKVWPNFEAVYGIPPEEAIGSTIYEMEQKKIFNPCISARVMKSLQPETMLQVTQNNKYLMCTSIPIFNDDNELDKIISYTRDVEKYELLQEEHQKLQDTMTSYLVQLEQLKQEYQKNSKIIGVSQKIKKLVHTAAKVAKFDATVFINGESGVGKNVLADFIHSSSKRADAPFISINCGAIPEHLLESELFGYEKGAFTGAGQTGKAGLIELADHGTLFLDEICDLPLHMQVKLLKVIQEKKVIRVGGVSEKNIDFRLIAATNKDAKKMVELGTFREDLYYRLNVLSLTVPPLRERKEDIFPLINHFSKKFNEQYEINHVFTNSAVNYMEAYCWPGNIRELENVVERMILTAEDYSITEEQLPYYIYSNEQPYDVSTKNRTLKQILEDVEKEVLLDSYERHGTTTKVAKELGVSQPTVSVKLNKYLKGKNIRS